jgi:hypothetical protein
VMFAKRACELTRDQKTIMVGTLATAYAALATAYAGAGRFPEAVTTARQALHLAAIQTNTAVVNALQAQIKCYQAGLPFRDHGLTNTLPAADRP